MIANIRPLPHLLWGLAETWFHYVQHLKPRQIHMGSIFERDRCHMSHLSTLLILHLILHLNRCRINNIVKYAMFVITHAKDIILFSADSVIHDGQFGMFFMMLLCEMVLILTWFCRMLLGVAVTMMWWHWWRWWWRLGVRWDKRHLLAMPPNVTLTCILHVSRVWHAQACKGFIPRLRSLHTNHF